MKLHSITTPIGPATLAAIEPPLEPVTTTDGLIFWGQRDPVVLATLALASRAKWLAAYDRTKKVAIVLYPPSMAGQEFPIDTRGVDPVCPQCGASDYRSEGTLNWLCRSCLRKWRKEPLKPKGGKRDGAGRKKTMENT